MNNSLISREISPEKIIAQKLNGRSALIGVLALLGAYSMTGQITTDFV